MKGAVSFYDEESEILSSEMPNSALSKIKLSFALDFDIGQSYVTSKIIDRNGITRKLNIQAGIRGIELQKDLFRIKEYKMHDDDKSNYFPSHVFVKAYLKDSQLLIRKLPIIGTSDWLLIFEEDLFLLAARGLYDELEILG